MSDKVFFYCNGEEISTGNFSKLDFDSTQDAPAPFHRNVSFNIVIKSVLLDIGDTNVVTITNLNELFEMAHQLFSESYFLNFKMWVLKLQQMQHIEMMKASLSELSEEFKKLRVPSYPDYQFILNPVIKDISYLHKKKRDTYINRFHPRKVIKQYQCRIRNRPNSGHGFKNNKY